MNYYLFYTLFLLLNPLSLIFFALSFCLLHQFCCAVLLITLAVCTRPNFRRFVPLRFCVAKIWPGTRLIIFMLYSTVDPHLSEPTNSVVNIITCL